VTESERGVVDRISWRLFTTSGTTLITSTCGQQTPFGCCQLSPLLAVEGSPCFSFRHFAEFRTSAPYVLCFSKLKNGTFYILFNWQTLSRFQAEAVVTPRHKYRRPAMVTPKSYPYP